MLEIKNLSKSYNGTVVVKDVSFKVSRGEVLILLGTSGSGKTTTLKMINNIIPKSSGKVLIDGRDTDNVDPYLLRREIGYVIQSIGLFPHYTIEQNIAVVPELLNWSKKKINERIDELLKMIGLESDIKSRFPKELSGGQQQRVGLARALAADPPIILLDEPFGALDPITRNEIQNEFIMLEGILQKAMVLVTHDVKEAFKIGTKICLLDEGKIQQIGKPEDLFFKPANDFVYRFFANHAFELEPNLIKLKHLTDVLKPTNNPVGIAVGDHLSIAEASEYQPNEYLTFAKNNKTYEVKSGDILKIYYSNKDVIMKHV